jgi:3-methyladenine DNA glycosylase/8-oxoguanine DNA glycosylase
LGEAWRPYRSVACWYLWQTLKNEPLTTRAQSPRRSRSKSHAH